MKHVSVLSHDWKDELVSMVRGARERLTIVTPFVTTDGAGRVLESIDDGLRESGEVNVVTDLSPNHVTDGSLDLSAVASLVGTSTSSRLWHVPRLHAKVYVADQKCAIVTSGNLTSNAFYHNVEYGVRITDPGLLTRIHDDLTEFRTLGATVSREQLDNYAAAADKVRDAYRRQERVIDKSVKQAYLAAIRQAEDELVRFKLAGNTMHAVFVRTVLHLLRKHGPLRTTEIHRMVQQIHPDLCDDTIDRVIEGQHFGRKWKHAVRSAQQRLKEKGLATYADKTWRPTQT